ncbi:MAG: hybrid sensor histidine kinase/response regulator [Anaerolineae bacterium]
MGSDIAKTRRDILLLIASMAAVGILLLVLIAPPLLSLPPNTARELRVFYLLVGSLSGLLLAFYVTLAWEPLLRLAEVSETEQVESAASLLRAARTTARLLPVHLFYLPGAAVFVIAGLFSLVGWGPSAGTGRGLFLVIVVVGGLSVVLHLLSRRWLAPLVRTASPIPSLETVLGEVGEGVIVISSTGVIRLVNPAFAALVGRTSADLLGENVTRALPLPPIQDIINGVLSASGGRESTEIEVGGQVFTFSAVALGDNEGAILTLRDTRDDRALDHVKSEFISAVSHELRTPLTSILGFARLTRRTFSRALVPLLPESKRAQRAVERIEQNLAIMLEEGERLTALINDVLDIAALDAGKIAWQDRPFDLTALLQRVVEGQRAAAEAKGLVYRLDLEGDLPPLEADPERVAQIINNLISNAVKFTEEGEVIIAARKIESGADVRDWKAPAEGAVLVSVSDTGPGIAPASLPGLFERFRQVRDTLRDKPRGTGLGLAISRKIVLHYEGAIWVESVPGEGSTFSFALPRAGTGATLDVEEVHSGITPPPPVDDRDRPPLILVVDDEPAIRDLLKQELTDWGFRVQTAVNGALAITETRRLRPDLIVLDLRMPDISGLDVLQILKSDPKTASIPVVILSVTEERKRGLALGAAAYLYKPVDLSLLVGTISGLLEVESDGVPRRMGGVDS